MAAAVRQWLMQIVLFNLAALVGGAAQGLIGFGVGTVSVTLLALVFPFREVVPVVALLVIVPNLVMVWLTRHELDWVRGAIAACGMGIGLILGGHLLLALPVEWLKRGLGLVILAYVIVTLLHTPVPAAMPRFGWCDGLMLVLTAFVSGIIVGAVGVSPLPVLVYITTRYPKHKARAILTQTFVVASIVQNILYAQLGLLTLDLVWLVLATIPGVIIGIAIGNRWHARVDQKTFTRLLALLLAVPAVGLLFGT